MSELSHIGNTVQVFEWKWDRDLKKNLKKESYKAYFLGFGIDYEELRDGVGQYTSAILELDDGTVTMVPVFMIKFV